MADTTPSLQVRRFVALMFGTSAVLSLAQVAQAAAQLGPGTAWSGGLFLLNYLSLIVGGAAYGLWRGVGWCWYVLFALCMVMLPPGLHPYVGGRVDLGPLLGAGALWMARDGVGHRRVLPEPSGAGQVRAILAWVHVAYGAISLPVWLLVFLGLPGPNTGFFPLGLTGALLLSGTPLLAGLFLRDENPAGVGLLIPWYLGFAAARVEQAPLILALGAWVLSLLWWSSPRPSQSLANSSVG